MRYALRIRIVAIEYHVKRIGDYLLEKDTHAMIAAFVCALLPFFYVPTGFLAAVIVGLITLQKGAKSGAYVLVWVALPAIASLVMYQITPFDVLFLRCAVIWAFAIVWRQYQSVGLILELMVFVGVIAIVMLHIVIPDTAQWWMTELTKYINEVYSASQWKMNVEPTQLAARLAPVASGILSFFFACTVFLELLIARFWQCVLRNPGAFTKEFLHIRIGRFSAGLAVGMGVLVLLKVMPIVDAFPLVILPFFVAGLSLTHLIVQQKQFLLTPLIVLYMSLFFLPVVVVSVLAVVGFMDSWINFRKKVIKS